MLAGCLLAALTYFPLFDALTHFANPALEAAHATSPVDRDRRSRRVLVPVQADRHGEIHDLLRHGAIAPGAQVGELRPTWRRRRARSRIVKVGDKMIDLLRRGQAARRAAAKTTAFDTAVGDASRRRLSRQADPAEINMPMVILLLTSSSST